jgi:hypothetical protein
MTMSNFAGKEDFFAAAKRRFKEVPLPDGKSARIRSITAAEWADIDARNVDMKKGGLSAVGLRNSDLRLVAASVVDADGNPIFNDGDLKQLGEIDAGVIVPLVKAIKEHSGLRQDVEDALKNLSTTADSGSSSSSAAP